MLPTKFRVNWPFGPGEEAKNRFSRWLPWRPSWILDWNDFSYFSSISHPNVSGQLTFGFRRRSFLASLESIGLSVQEKKLKTDFQDGRHGGHLGFPIAKDFSYFWSTSHPDAFYQVSSKLAQGCRRSRLLKQLLTAHDEPWTTHDRHWLTTIAHHGHFVLSQVS